MPGRGTGDRHAGLGGALDFGVDGAGAAQYERERDAAAEKLKCRVPILDRLVAAARGRNEADTSGSGQPLMLADIEPWPERSMVHSCSMTS